MRRKIVTAAAVGALGLTGLAVATPAMAAGSSATAAVTDQVDRLTEALSGLVDDGTITQEQADTVADTLAESDALPGPGGPGGPGAHGGPGGGLEAAATALGLTADELRTALEADGATLATVAEAQGVDVDTLVAALVEEETTRIEASVTDGSLTRAEADERLAGLAERVAERVAQERPEPGADGEGPRPPR